MKAQSKNPLKKKHESTIKEPFEKKTIREKAKKIAKAFAKRIAKPTLQKRAALGVIVPKAARSKKR